ncbi:lamin tail domain-containing protein [Longimicrobium sp.]|uniref:lamin tail domain-containing protein n=1 Tax=Longimicrobium sp. TaxID=2029185 RepID=UPI002E375CF3|nr:lamin tail domain-containing protein [Longimicrobium sp.]HEX6038786.1 lamin tail domain-containing protein [Longimicrobium sp.]
MQSVRVPQRLAASAFLMAALAACADQPVGSVAARDLVPETVLAAFDCTATREAMQCTSLRPGMGDARGVVMGGQNVTVRLASSNASYNAQTETFSVDVTVQNLMNEAIGTPDGVTPDPAGVMVFFMAEPNPTGGSGEITVDNASGTAFFTSANQAYHTYNEVLDKNEVSPPKTWQFHMPSTATGFRFTVALETSVQPLLVINEVLANPANFNANPDVSGEWFEIYNGGTRPVDLQGLVIADSAASGRRPYHLIASSVVVQPGGYAVLGNNGNTTTNGGVTVDYAYGAAMALANSLDAVKIARVVGTDTLTIDRVQYSQASTSAKDGISRELTNPALDNSNMDGSNWGDATVTSVYGAGGRGTPKAQNSTYVP